MSQSCRLQNVLIVQNISDSTAMLVKCTLKGVLPVLQNPGFFGRKKTVCVFEDNFVLRLSFDFKSVLQQAHDHSASNERD